MVSSVVETNASSNVYLKEDGYTIRIEYNQEFVIIHLEDIDHFTKDIFRRMQQQLLEWSKFFAAMGRTHIWAAVPDDKPQIKRLLGGLNFKYAGRSDNMTVYNYEV